ncbi:MAG: hypothetical protein ACNA7G_11740 [Methylobacter sp.]
MDYTALLQELNKASLFDLHRLQSAIYQELQNPMRIDQIKAQLKIGQPISYFDPESNRLIDAVILKIKRTRCLVKNNHDQKNWNLPFYYLNLDNSDTDIQVPKNAVGITKSSLKVGAKVGYKSKYNEDVFGEVLRLNQKTATVKVNERAIWRVPYRLLFPIIDGELGDLSVPTYLPYDPLAED